MATRSILPNSSAEILRPIQSARGIFRVVWIEALDSHALFLDDVALASHHNGFSCHVLATRMIDVWAGKRAPEYALEQFDYILRCGGMGKSRDAMAFYINPN